MRVMAIDYGDAHTGVALSDPTGFLAGYTTTINSRRQEVVVDELAKLIQQHRPGEVVLGFPKNMDGTDGRKADLYRELAVKLEERTGMRVILWDERRTTIDAHQILFSQGNNLICHLVEGKVKKAGFVHGVAVSLAVLHAGEIAVCKGLHFQNQLV